MDTAEEMIQSVQDDLTLDDNSTLLPPDVILRNLNRAKRKVEALFPWPETEDAKTFTVPVGATQTEYWDYPQGWRPDSIKKLVVNGDDYGRPKTHEDYLYEQENDNPNGDTVMWANHGKRFFIDPALSAGDVVKIWGKKILPKLVADGDTTIFSYSLPEINDAICQEAVEICKAKGEAQSDQMLSEGAKATVARVWQRTAQETAKEVKTRPMLDVQDMFATTRTKTRRGMFD